MIDFRAIGATSDRMMYGKFVILDVVPVEVLLDNMHDSYLPTFVMRSLRIIVKRTRKSTAQEVYISSFDFLLDEMMRHLTGVCLPHHELLARI